MHPNFRLFVYFLGFILAAVIAVKPYNLFCGLTAIIEPEYISKFIERFQCLCTRKYKLRPNEEMDLQMVFAVKGGFIEASNYVLENYKNNPIKLRYQVE